MAKVKLAMLDDVPEGGMIVRQHGDKQIMLVRVAGEVYAMNDVCSHSGAPLHEGDLGLEGPCFVTCPWHTAHFDVRTGRAHPDTDWATDLESYPVQVTEGEIFVDV